MLLSQLVLYRKQTIGIREVFNLNTFPSSVDYALDFFSNSVVVSKCVHNIKS